MPISSLARRLFRRAASAQADASAPATEHPTGRIDIHCHLIPGVDDGCESVEQAITCILRLRQVGYTGAICTPHVIPKLFPDNTMPNIRRWTAQLQQALLEAGVDHQLWPGGELRLFDGVVEWLERNEVPTLGGTRWVLTDAWENQWQDWIDEAFDWLFDRGYQPILAHPERLNVPDLAERIEAVRSRGVLLQGNLGCFSGGEGERAARWVRTFCEAGRYDILAMDVHRPDSIERRIEGLETAREDFGAEAVDTATIDAPRRILGLDQ